MGKHKLQKRDEWYTPKYILDNLQSMFGFEFDYDPATTKENAERLNIENYDTIETNGLEADWKQYKNIWINPPFTNKQGFIEKALSEFENSDIERIFFLLPYETIGTNYFYDYFHGKNLTVISSKQRIKFIDENFVQQTVNMFGSGIYMLSKHENEQGRYILQNLEEVK